MSIAQQAINTSHTDRQWHILFLNTRNIYIYIYIYIYIFFFFFFFFFFKVLMVIPCTRKIKLQVTSHSNDHVTGILET